MTSTTTARMGLKPGLIPPPTVGLHHYRHRAVATSDHRGTARGFLPRGLSNTCPQVCATRPAEALRGQVSNKPKHLRVLPAVRFRMVRLPIANEDGEWRLDTLLLATSHSPHARRARRSRAGQYERFALRGWCAKGSAENVEFPYSPRDPGCLFWSPSSYVIDFAEEAGLNPNQAQDVLLD